MDNPRFEHVVIRSLYSLAQAIAVTNDTALRILEPTLKELATLEQEQKGIVNHFKW